MSLTIQNAICKLLASATQTVGTPVYALRRNGRLASFLSDSGVLQNDLPGGVIDATLSPLAETALNQTLSDVYHKAQINQPLFLPARTDTGELVASLVLDSIAFTDQQRVILESIAQTIGTIIQTIQFSSEQGSLLHDPLTHLSNSTMFGQRLADEIDTAQRSGGRVGVFMIDLDNFTAINLEHGHAIGDRVLQKVASRLHHAVRRSDLPARISEDKFGVIGSMLSDQPEGTHIADRLIKTLSQPMEINGKTIEPSASLGIAIYPTDGLDAETLAQSARQALHRAKIRGKNQFEYFTPQHHAQAMERLELEKRLAVAIDKGQLTLHYQPILDRAEKITNVEALVRWNHPEQGMIPPGKFIPIAEQTGMIIKIGNWVLREAAQQASQWALAGMPIRININVSALQLAKNDFVETVSATLDATQVDPGLLELEVTEGLFENNSREIVDKIAALRNLGLRIAIDDFGSGYSSLSRVHALPIDTLKIDRAFINEITVKDSPTPLHHRTAVLRAMATLGHSLGLKLVAEGVESRDQARFLLRIGYDALQGYLFSKPVPADDIPVLVQKFGLSLDQQNSYRLLSAV